MKKVLMLGMMAVVMAASAAPKKGAAKAEGETVRVSIEQFPKLGKPATLEAPSLSGGSNLGSVWDGRPRRWIVLEAKYKTYDHSIDRLTFVWHVLLETKSAWAKGEKERKSDLAPYSYFTQTVSYANVLKGTHAACVCLHPSYYEQYGEPKAVGLVVKDSAGNVIAGDTISEVRGIKKSSEFWDDPKIMDAQSEGGPMIERRQGLVDRSKTIWALVNPNDYEMVVQ